MNAPLPFTIYKKIRGLDDADSMRALIRAKCPRRGDQGKLARELNVSPQFLSAVLCGKKEPTEKIAAYFGRARVVVYPKLRRADQAGK
jgi:hypothetical protein